VSGAAWGVEGMGSSPAQPEIAVNAGFDKLAAGARPVVVESVTTPAPPGSPAEFALYGVPAGATGAWSGEDGKLARYFGAAWEFFAPPVPLRAFVVDEGQDVTLTAAGWVRGGAVSPWGAATGFGVREVEVAAPSGSSVAASGLILDRDVIFGVSATSLGVTGAASFDVGVAGELDKFGGALGVALGASNLGVVAPTAFYADTDIVLTANGGDFAGGSVRLAAHFVRIGAPGAS
jgi:hypothetical protein